MSENVSKALDDKIYAILTEHLGEPWSGLWIRIRNSFESENSTIAQAIKNRVWNQVVTRAFIDVKDGKTTYYDKSLIELWEAPLEYGQLFVNPITEKLEMIGYKPPPQTRVVGFQGSANAARDKKESSREVGRHMRVRFISPSVFFCKGFDGKWYEVHYDFQLKKEYFEGGKENFGHIDHLQDDVVMKDGESVGYTKTLLSPREIEKYSLPMAS